jgi:hypothetical protein
VVHNVLDIADGSNKLIEKHPGLTLLRQPHTPCGFARVKGGPWDGPDIVDLEHQVVYICGFLFAVVSQLQLEDSVMGDNARGSSPSP